MRILVVDDEYFARKALIQNILDWSAEVIVEEAENGEEALEKIQSQKFDLLFSDIRMPKLDGIQLASILFEQYPQIYNVIISGYDDFQYAQKAIAYKVEHYLLKPIEKADIFKILNQVQEDVKKHAHELFLEQLASFYHEEHGVENGVIKLPSAESYRTVVVQASALNEEWLSLHLKRKLCETGIETYLIRSRRFTNMFIVLLLQQQMTIQPAKLEEIGGRLIDDYTMHTGSHMTIGISSSCTSDEDLIKSYKEAKHAILHRFIEGSRTGVFLYEDVNRQQYPYNLECAEELLQPLYNKMVSNQAKEAHEIIAKLLKWVVEKRLSVHTLHDTCAKLTALMNSVMDRVNQNKAVPESYLDPLDLYELNTMDELADYFSSQVDLVMGKLEQVLHKHDIADQIKDYVEKNYRYNILLEDMAKNLFYTDVSYLSRQFKKKNGISFSTYLLSVRMQNAKKLLETTPQLSIAEISTAVGFNDYSYFIQTYKKFYGETPGRSKQKDHS